MSAVFILDTGSNHTIVSSKLVDIATPSLKDVVVTKKGSGYSGSGIFTRASLAVGPVLWQDHRILAMDTNEISKSMGESVDGMLGMTGQCAPILGLGFRISSTSGRFPASRVLYCCSPTALRFTTDRTILAIAGVGWLRPSLCWRSVCSVSAVSLRVLHPFRSRRCKTHVPVRVGRQNLKGFLDPYAIRS